MWTLVLFDLPTASAFMGRMYSRFRKNLLRLGFEMFQKSAYLHWEDSDNAAETLKRRVMAILPADGQVTILPLTQRAWQNVRVSTNGVVGSARAKPEDFLVLG
ncbi:MAG: CRISPR-associated endonuclease Cas2 [Kiritimatiellae bacterium]|nr:CRISPR-associated endonuclease Cas2 [Kiritimatiellia bacterium]